jgi:pyruvate dehydrogenase E2 component (dihydrolipoamide acetyltransferase)
MPYTVTMPKLSPTMSEGTIAKWHKKVGDFIEAGELLAEITTDKATVEHNALDPGYLRKILCEAGQKASVNSPLAVFTDESSESIDGYVPEGTAPVKIEKPAAPKLA